MRSQFFAGHETAQLTGQAGTICAGIYGPRWAAEQGTDMTFKPETHAGTWLYAAAVLSLVGGIITGLAFGTQTFGGDFFSAAATWVGWAFFACGFAGFVLFAATASIVERLTSIRYLVSLQVSDQLAQADKAGGEEKQQARPNPIHPGRGFE